ncbi:hypothetical protein GBA52_003625 [Prunus armeniaca]|nr:hypothetical protein GBA52_003625 [Prunus armeniaca]
MTRFRFQHRLISTSICYAIDCPYNYTCNYLADLLPLFVRHVVYLDSDLILVDDIAKLAATSLCPVIDLHCWRGGEYTTEIEEWMEVQKLIRIYELSSLLLILMVFVRNIDEWMVWSEVDHHGCGVILKPTRN